MKWKIEGGHCEGPANDPMNDFEVTEEADTLIEALITAYMHCKIPRDAGWIEILPSEEQ